jgi:glycosyltransferase involved in cell wall biosynthesis
LNFTKYADGFILATKSLQNALGVNDRPVAICNGTYQVEHQRECNNKFVDNKKNKLINCVYAGTFDPRKGGCFAAIAAAEFLPENYHLHIIGFGSDKDIENVKKLVIETSQKSKAHVTYDGLKSGEDYISFIQSCDIGLSTQNPSGIYNSTSFPSKILSYLANGLRVVCVRIPVVEESDVGQVIYYYDKQTPEEIAKAIVSVDLSKEYDSRDLIRKLDIKFRSDLQHVLFE